MTVRRKYHRPCDWREWTFPWILKFSDTNSLQLLKFHSGWLHKCHQRELQEVRKEEIDELKEKIRELKSLKKLEAENKSADDLETNDVIIDQRKDSKYSSFKPKILFYISLLKRIYSILVYFEAIKSTKAKINRTLTRANSTDWNKTVSFESETKNL